MINARGGAAEYRGWQDGRVLWRREAAGLANGVVRLAKSSPTWPRLYTQLADSLRDTLGELAVDIEHVGSTAVPGLTAKPIIDIAVRLAPAVRVFDVVEAVAPLGYEFRGDKGDEGGLLFVLEEPPGQRVAHVHAVRFGDRQWPAYLAVRDRLRDDPATRAAYAKLKRELATEFPTDRPAYTDGKAPFLAALQPQRPA